MNGGKDIVVKDVYCIACGQALRLRRVAEGCPACGMDVCESLRQTILAGGHRHVRQIARALMLAGCLNIGLAVGCVLNPATMAITGWYGPLGVVFLLSVVVYAWLQVAAAARAARARPGERAGRGRVVLLITGVCFTGAALAGLGEITAHVLGATVAGLDAIAGMVTKGLLPGVIVFLWVLGGVYQEICRTAGMQGLGRRNRRVKYINVLGSALLSVGVVLMPGWAAMPDWRHSLGTRMTAAEMLLGAGGLLFIGGMMSLTMLQFLMARRLKDLSETLGERTRLTGMPVE